MTIILVGCVSQKEPTPMPARHLYTGELFRRRRRFAEKSGSQWFVLSALYGLVDPETVVEPYDVALKRLSKDDQRAWGLRVAKQLEARFGSLRGLTFEVHAGEEYATALVRPLQERGAALERPLKGLRIGEQLQWYDRHASAPSTSRPEGERRGL